MRKLALLVALCTAVFCLAPFAHSAELDMAPFEKALERANWQVPPGYTVETYLAGNLTGDGTESVVASMTGPDGASRLLAVVVEGPSPLVYLAPTALADKLPENDPFMGFTTARPGSFSIHMGDGASTADTTYTFGYFDGLFYLDTVSVRQWDVDTGEATQSEFHLDIGEYRVSAGEMKDGVFTTHQVLVHHLFDPNLAVILLEEFDMDLFPTDWDTFAQMVGGGMTPPPEPTQKTTAKPRQTKKPNPTGMPGPVYPTDMPGPVYPTDMPGPVYPTDMPGPVYPTDMPGPVYPTPSPTPTGMPGPIYTSDGPVEGAGN